MIYNNNSKAINIENINLVNSDNSGFRINVDGMKGNNFSNVEIRRRDSLFVFVEVTPVETNNNAPSRQVGKINFSYNGIRQEVILESYGQDAIRLKGKVFFSDTILSGEKPFLIYDSIIVKENVTLTLNKNVRFFIHDKVNIRIDGTLICNGERNSPVVFRGDRTDNLFSNLPYDELSAQWGGMRFTQNSYGNKMLHTEFRGSTTGIVIDSASVETEKLYIDHSKFKLSSGNLLSAENVRMNVSNSLFTNSGGSLVYLNGGDYRFTFCTIANLYNIGSITGSAVYLQNYKLDTNARPIAIPLINAKFENCIIWGKRDLEVSLDSAFLNKPIEALYDFKFDHCLIKARGEDDNKFINTVWNKDPAFKKIEGEVYLFDFHLDSISEARDKGNSIYSFEFPEDLDGSLRRQGMTDIGAYQYNY